MTNNLLMQTGYLFTAQSIMRFAILIATIAMVACSRQESDSIDTQVDGSNTPESIATTDAWEGQWTGPEGTFLMIAGSQGQYEITIQDLDGPLTYNGSSVGNQIKFVRKGINESIYPTDGAGTGMKWLVDKKNCLAIRFGEGYCRN